jgi:protein-serine/threonine kinase
MEGPEPSSADLVSSPPHADSLRAGLPPRPRPPGDTTPRPSAHLNPSSAASNALLPSFDSGNKNFHYHIRAPSTGLTLQTDFSAHPALQKAAVLEDSGAEPLRQSATAPIAIQDQSYLRTAWSSHSVGSLSPGSLLSSPALNALSDLTPLPSPLVMSDSPGPWHRAVQRPRGASGSSLSDLHFSPHRGSLSPSPSLKKKGYQRLKEAAIDAAAAASHSQQKNEAARERNRSVSEFTPESLHNTRPRHVTVGNATIGSDASLQQQHMHREVYLAAQRGLVSVHAGPGLPTPPASNASNRSVTDTEEEEVAEEDSTRYIVVRQGPERTKKLWRPVRQLGQGTFSKVYLATCEKTKAKDPLDEALLDPRKLVAIKVVEHGPAGGADEERVELSLKREVEMLRSVSHPSLVHLQAFDHDDAQALIVLTYCPGGDLFDVASDHRDQLTPGIVQRIFAEMVSAARYLHDQLIVHRDIKLESTASLLTRTCAPLAAVCVLTTYRHPVEYPHRFCSPPQRSTNSPPRHRNAH